ncbi:uncharacterized protein LOC118747790 [Rhagoletis pomonella]|uniref:uncharacterized protein LOC118747790 n=1 Tax=Rhagoletis pomonella TaxID=28610 RepID=UPI00177F279A|nr:uncharacterized protein LOC118747790 [Rhagoletis pomonella]
MMANRQRLTQDICNLSTLCSNYKKLSPTVEFSPLQQQLLCPTNAPSPTPMNNGTAKAGNVAENDADDILSLLKMWQTEGQFKQLKIRNFLLSAVIKNAECMTTEQRQEDNSNNERLRVYANQLENVLSVLQACEATTLNYGDLQKLRYDIEIVKANANWTNIIVDRAEVNSNSVQLLATDNSSGEAADVNANAAVAEMGVN